MFSFVRVTMRVEIDGQYGYDPMLYEQTKEIGQGGNPLYVLKQFEEAEFALAQDVSAVLKAKFKDIRDVEGWVDR
jgi:hypothetical protein